MDDFIFSGFLILVFVILPLGLIFLFYFIPKKLGHPKIGKVLSIGLLCLILFSILTIIFEDSFFTKKDATELLAEQEIILNDRFDIDTNYSTSAISDYYHTFTLKISEKDKRHIIRQIKESNNFKVLKETTDDLLYKDRKLTTESKITSNYETKEAYVREYFQGAEPGYAPTFRRVIIDKLANKLVFEDIDD